MTDKPAEVLTNIRECKSEQILAVETVMLNGDRVEGWASTGPWNEVDGALSVGSFGPLIDSVLGYAIIFAGGPGAWSVSTDITIDVIGALPDRGERVRGEARMQGDGDAHPFSVGSLTTEDGRIIAHCTQHGRYVQVSPPEAVAPEEDTPVPSGADLIDILDVDVIPTDAGADVRLSVTPRVQNPLTNMHGGMSIAVCDIAATAALASRYSTVRTSSLHVSYVRPLTAGSDAVFEARVAHAGRTYAVVDVVGTANGRICVLGRLTFDTKL